MMLAIAFLLMVLIIVCVIKRNRGGKYAVHERELAAGRGDYDEGGFHEYSQPLDTKSAGGRASQASSSHQDQKHPESDTDSMAEYGEGDTGEYPLPSINHQSFKNKKIVQTHWLF